MNLWGWLPTLRIPDQNARNQRDAPDAESPQVERWKNQLALCRTLYGGWEEVIKAARTLLPSHPKEAPEDYYIRLRRPTFYNAFGRTVRALSGTVFNKPPAPVEVPSEILALYEDDIDLEGTEGNAFLLHAFNDALITGLTGIFVDMPTNTGNPTKLEAQQLDLRPFWKLVRKDDIVSIRVDVVNGKSVLGQLVFRECAQRQVGDFGVDLYDVLRVYRRTMDAVTYESWVRQPKTTKWVRDGDVGTFRGVTEIPFAPIYTGRVDFMDATPPLTDLANLNLLHYQVNSDLHHAAHIANVPFIFGWGMDDTELQIGPNRAVIAKDRKGDEVGMKWMETQGASIGSTRSILADIEEQMSNLGLGMLQRKSRAAETADKAKIDKQEQDSTLAAMVSDLEHGVDMALHFTAQFLDLPKGGHIEFSRDFQLDPVNANNNQNKGAPSDPNDPTPITPARTAQPVGA